MKNEIFRSLIIRWVDIVIYTQLSVVMFLAAMTVLLMIFRKHKNARLEQLRNRYALDFIEELLGQIENAPVTVLTRPSRFTWLHRRAMQETLLTQINAVSGTERDYAVKRYFQLGFVKDDIKRCLSIVWWRRLQGLSHLSSLETPSLARILDYLRQDKNQIVALYALLGLSSLDHELNNPALFESLATQVRGLDNIFLEITRNWSRQFGINKLVDFIDRSQSPDIRNAFIAAICQLKTPEAAKAISTFLMGDSNYPPELISNMILSIREIGDPFSGIIINNYLHHNNELVRQRALEYLTSMNNEIPPKLIEIIKEDQSPGVKRIYQQWLTRRAS